MKLLKKIGVVLITLLCFLVAQNSFAGKQQRGNVFSFEEIRKYEKKNGPDTQVIYEFKTTNISGRSICEYTLIMYVGKKYKKSGKIFFKSLAKWIFSTSKGVKDGESFTFKAKFDKKAIQGSTSYGFQTNFGFCKKQLNPGKMEPVSPLVPRLKQHKI